MIHSINPFKAFAIVIAFHMLFTMGHAQKNAYVRYTPTDSSVRVQTTNGTYEFKGYSAWCVETNFYPNGDQSNKPSHAIKAKAQKDIFKITETASALHLNTPELQIAINKKELSITYLKGTSILLKETNGFHSTAYGIEVEFEITPEEVLYGGGARALGMNRRGHKLELYNKAHYGYEEHSELMNYCMPIALSSKRYLIHFDNPEIGYLDLDSGKKNILNYASIGGRRSYQVVAGDSWPTILTEFSAISGRQPLPPRWMLGNFASRFGYHSEAETRKTVEQFAKDSIPLDAVILDLYWFGKEIQGTLGNLAFYTDSFPTPKKMISDFAQQGVKTILITEPFVLTTSTRWQDAVQSNCLAKDSLGKPFTYDFYFGNTGLIDIYAPEGYAWFWKRYAELIDLGVSGFWGDLGEPEVHPERLLHRTGTANQVHNVYGHDWAALLHNQYVKNYPTTRPFILMRSGYSGTQRYGIVPWSGDVNRTWGGLKPQMEISLQMGMQGIGYMHSDLGGFAGSKDDSELYVRWLQYGVFQPVFRPHAQESVPSEAVYKDPKTKALAKKAIDLRYALLPYNYTLAKENSTTGLPLMRPLLFECPADTGAYTISSTYLWGSDILVAPVTDSAAREVAVHFPNQSVWFDFYTHKKVEQALPISPSTSGCLTRKMVPVTLDHIPTYVRGGAFIPMVNGLKNTAKITEQPIEIHFYYDETVNKSSGKVYDDDGITRNTSTSHELALGYQRTSTGTHEITVHSTGQATHSYTLILHHIDPAKIQSILWGKKKIDFVWNEKQNGIILKNIPIVNGENKLIFKLK